jgi:hypothetical protein
MEIPAHTARHSDRGILGGSTVLVAALACLALSAADTSAAGSAGRLASCPKMVPTGPPSHNPWKAAARKLVPTPVTEIRLCRYSQRFVRGTLVPSGELSGLVHDFDALRPATRKERRVFYSCPYDANPIVAHLAYANGRAMQVYVTTYLCVYASNGDITQWESPAARTHLRNALIRLTTP